MEMITSSESGASMRLHNFKRAVEMTAENSMIPLVDIIMLTSRQHVSSPPTPSASFAPAPALPSIRGGQTASSDPKELTRKFLRAQLTDVVLYDEPLMLADLVLFFGHRSRSHQKVSSERAARIDLSAQGGLESAGEEAQCSPETVENRNVQDVESGDLLEKRRDVAQPEPDKLSPTQMNDLLEAQLIVCNSAFILSGEAHDNVESLLEPIDAGMVYSHARLNSTMSTKAVQVAFSPIRAYFGYHDGLLAEQVLKRWTMHRADVAKMAKEGKGTDRTEADETEVAASLLVQATENDMDSPTGVDSVRTREERRLAADVDQDDPNSKGTRYADKDTNHEGQNQQDRKAHIVNEFEVAFSERLHRLSIADLQPTAGSGAVRIAALGMSLQGLRRDRTVPNARCGSESYEGGTSRHGRRKGSSGIGSWYGKKGGKGKAKRASVFSGGSVRETDFGTENIAADSTGENDSNPLPLTHTLVCVHEMDMSAKCFDYVDGIWGDLLQSWPCSIGLHSTAIHAAEAVETANLRKPQLSLQQLELDLSSNDTLRIRVRDSFLYSLKECVKQERRDLDQMLTTLGPGHHLQRVSEQQELEQAHLTVDPEERTEGHGEEGELNLPYIVYNTTDVDLELTTFHLDQP
eukprot:g2359.t1